MQGLETGMQSLPIANREHLLALDADARAQRVVGRVSKWHHSIQAIVCAFEFDQDQQAIKGSGRLCKEAARRKCSEADGTRALQKAAARRIQWGRRGAHW